MVIKSLGIFLYTTFGNGSYIQREGENWLCGQHLQVDLGSVKKKPLVSKIANFTAFWKSIIIWMMWLSCHIIHNSSLS
jgi:hypothetical protein